MAKFQSGRTLGDVRLRNWPAGRVAQLKLAVQNLEGVVNSSLAQSVQQTSRRKVSEKVPFILDLDVRAGFRQAQVAFSAPPGLNGHPFRQLLFYEIQHGSDTSFFDATTLTTPKTSVVVGGLGAGGTRSFRARIVNTFGVAGPWSETESIQLARTRIQTTDIPDFSRRLEKPKIGDFAKVFDFEYQSLGGSMCVNLHASMACPHHDLDRRVGGVTRETLYGGPAFVQFRFLLGRENSVGQTIFEPLGASRQILSARPGFLSTANLEARTPTAFGTLMTPFFTAEDSDELVIRLEASKMTSSEWRGRSLNRAMQVSDPLLFIRNGKVIEVLDS